MLSSGPFDFNCPGCRLVEVGPRYAIEALVYSLPFLLVDFPFIMVLWKTLLYLVCSELPNTVELIIEVLFDLVGYGGWLWFW